VRVSASYLPDQSQPDAGRWFWAYHVRIENDGDVPVQLLTRYWIIRDGNGVTQEVRGEGVIGEQPVIAPGDSYDYVSGCPLGTQYGTMEGSYQMVAEDGSSFDAVIPRFQLTVPEMMA
jgi:ApaG protein